ncbi:MAG: urease accessory protein UreD [Candidatus Aquicultorales bacterium]
MDQSEYAGISTEMLTTYASSAKRGLLRLQLGLKDGRTIVKDAYNSGPLKIAKPFYPDSGAGGIYLCQMSTGGGLVQGDDYHQEIEVEPGAQVFLTTQSSTKIYRTPNSFARQVTRLKVGKGALFEYLPEPVVPFAGSRFFGETQIFLEDGATVFIGEVITPGRIGRGEIFAFDHFQTTTRAYWDEKLIYCSNQMLGGTHGLQSLGLYEGYTHQGSFLIFSNKVTQDASDHLHELLTRHPDLLASASLMHKNGISVRLLGNRATHLELAISACWEWARQAICGLEKLDVRKSLFYFESNPR